MGHASVFSQPADRRMKSVFEWLSERPFLTSRPWLILGKGPSFSKLSRFDTAAFSSLALNDAAREARVDIAHAIDIQVIERSGDAIAANAGVLVMPWHPHVNFNAGAATLEEHARTLTVLKRLDDEGRLLWYNLSTTNSHFPGSPVVSARFFSAEAAINLLVSAGVRKIRSLGVDGGATYSASFRDLNSKSLLANGRPNFDKQFEEIATTIMRTGLDFGPLDMDCPAKIYVAATEAQMLSVKVLEYSVRKHASLSVQVFPMHEAPISIPLPKAKENLPRTPFSFQRFLIPALAGRKGRALYLDSDMQVFQDIRHLWALPFDEADVLTVGDTSGTGRRPQFSVMLLDCAALDWDIGELVKRLDEGSLTYEALVYEMKAARTVQASIPPQWNSLEDYRPGETALLHYTDMHTQPWVHAENPNGHLWVRDLREAIEGGFIGIDYVGEHIKRGWVRPSLLWQIEHGKDDGRKLSRSARKLDSSFRPPYLALQHQSASSNVDQARISSLARFYRRSPLYRLQQFIGARMIRR